MKTIITLLSNLIEYCHCSRSESNNNLPNPKCRNCGKLLP